jgi:hypothetical protein
VFKGVAAGRGFAFRGFRAGGFLCVFAVDFSAGAFAFLALSGAALLTSRHRDFFLSFGAVRLQVCLTIRCGRRKRNGSDGKEKKKDG